MTLGSGSEDSAAAAGDGRLVFAGTEKISNLWSLPIDSDSGIARGDLEPVTQDAAWQTFPSISADGKRLAFGLVRSGSTATPKEAREGRDVWLLDLETGVRRPLAETPEIELTPIISADGSQVAYLVIPSPDSGARVIRTVPAAGGPAELACGDCGEPNDWSADRRTLLFSRFSAGVTVLDLSAGRTTDLVTKQGNYFSHGRFSPDGRWVAFESGVLGDPEDASVFVVRIPDEGTVPHNEWNLIGGGASADSTPRWSPDGSRLYFQSNRDSFLCIWTQTLDPATKSPIGEPELVLHFHRARLSPAHLRNPGVTGLAVARDRIVVTVAELRGDIWLMETASP